MEILVTKFMPMFILIFLGYRMQNNKKITDEVIEGIKYILFNLAIPSIIFLSYVRATIQVEYMLIFFIMFMINCIMLLLGKLLRKHFIHEYAPWYFAGFENGMIGIPIFTALWGMEILPLLSLISLGNALFIWFVYIPLIEYKNNASVDIKSYSLSMIKSPIMISILGGIFLNVSGIFEAIELNVLTQGVLNLLQILGNITTSMILIILGYSMKLSNINVTQNIKYITIRLIGLTFLAFASFSIINQTVGDVDSLFPKLYIAYFMLPPLFILPPYIAQDKRSEISFFSNSVLIYTFISFIGIAIVALS